MILDRNNKHSVEIGDFLKFSENEMYRVNTVIASGNNVSFSLQDVKTKQTIYCYPSSKCYGSEIVKAFEEKKYFCTESENSYTESELHNAWKDAIKDGDTYCTSTFEDFKKNCMVENNGTLKEVKKEYSVFDHKANKEVFSLWNIRTDLF